MVFIWVQGLGQYPQSSPVFPAPHLVSLRCSSPKNCMHDGWTHLLSTCWFWAQQETPWWVKQLQPSAFVLFRWLETSMHQTSQIWPSDAIGGTEPECKGPGSDKSLPRESSGTAGVCWVRWCRQIKQGAMEETKPGRGGGVSKVSRWQEPEWAEWSAGRLACLVCREQKSGVWDKAVAIRPTSCSFPVYFSVLLCVF